MTDASELAAAWAAWEKAPRAATPAFRKDDAVRAVAAAYRASATDVHDQITRHRRDGHSITVAVRETLATLATRKGTVP